MLNKFFYSFILSMGLVFNFPISAKIIETNEMATIQDEVTRNSLVLFNITGTLYEPAITLADNQWRIYFAERVNALVADQTSANGLINKIKNEIVNYLPKKPVESFTPLFIARLQNQKIPVLGITEKQRITSYTNHFDLITRNHLLSIGIDFENTLLYLKIKEPQSEIHDHFAYGILFAK